jgi:hypothetical protein
VKIKDIMVKGCNFEGCTRVYFGKGYCHVHYERYWKYGRYESVKQRTITIVNGVVTISTALMKKAIIIDEDTYKDINPNIWWYDSKVDVVFASINGKCTQLKDVVFGEKEGNAIIKHHNDNGADCRKQNLFAIEWCEAFQTKSISVNNSSGVRGVSYSTSKKRWIASLRFQGKQHHKGRGYRSKTNARGAVLGK